MSNYYVPRTDKTPYILGSELTGTDGQTGRIWTLLNANSVAQGMTISVDTGFLQQNRDYHKVGDDIVFDVAIFDNAQILIDYFTVNTAPPSGITWVSTSDLINTTGFNFPNEFLSAALSFAEKDIIRHIFVTREDLTQQPNTSQTLKYRYAMDLNGDSLVTQDDIDIVEYDYLGQEYDLNMYKQQYIEEEFRLVTSTSVPTATDRTLHIRYKTGREFFPDMIEELRELETLIAANYIYNRIPISKLQAGIESWTINNVNVNFSPSAIKSVVDANKERIHSIMNQLRPKRADGVRIGYTYKYDGLGRKSLKLR